MLTSELKSIHAGDDRICYTVVQGILFLLHVTVNAWSTTHAHTKGAVRVSNSHPTHANR